MHQIPSPTRRGSAMMTVVVMLIVLGGLSVVMTNVAVMGVQESTNRYNQVALLMSAESAVNAAISDLQQNYEDRISTVLDADGKEYVPNLSLYGSDEINGATCDALIERIYTNPMDPDLITFKVTATATTGDPADANNYRRTRVEATIQPAPQEIFKQAMFALEGYDFMGSATTDSWNSDPSASGGGSYGDAGTSITGNGDLSSEGDINANLSNVGGQVFDNQEFPLPLFDYNDEVSGIAYTSTVLDDTYVALNGTAVSGSVSNLTLTTGKYRFEEIRMSSKSQIEVDGKVEIYVDGLVDWAKAELLYLNSPDTTVRIYQGSYPGSDGDSNWTLNGNSVLGDGRETSPGVWDVHPSNLIILSNFDGYIKMNGTGTFAGVFFAPAATAQYGGNFDYFGSMIARRYDTGTSGGTGQGKVNGNFRFHYDDSLGALDLDLDARLLMQGWRSFNLGYNWVEPP